MLISEPALPGRNEYGFSDPTPAMARWRVIIVTFEELVAAIAEKTGEHPKQVEHLVRAWIRDGLLPKPKIVPIPGKRGTRGDYGEAAIIGYLAVKALRPKGKPLSLVFAEPDWGNIADKWAWFFEYGKWLEREFGFNIGQIDALQKANALPPPPPELAEKWDLLEKRPKRKPTVRRVRLNTETLARLIPIARGEKPEKLDDLYLYYYVWGIDVPEELMSEFDQLEFDAVKFELKKRAVETIWKAVCTVETGQEPDKLEMKRNEVVGYRDGKEIWRISNSKWRAGREN